MLEEKYDRLARRHEELNTLLASGSLDAPTFAKLSKEYADLTPLAEAIAGLAKQRREQADLEALIADPSSDAEMRRAATMVRRSVATGC